MKFRSRSYTQVYNGVRLETGSTEERGTWIHLIGMILFSMLVSRVLFYLIYLVMFRNPSFGAFLEHINLWDSEWYTQIIEQGYPTAAKGQASWAFFPLYPMTVRLLTFLTGGSANLISFIVSNLCCFVAAIYGWMYVVDTRGNREEADFYTMLMILGVCGFYESIMYTEAMYLMFLSMAFYYMNRQEYFKMGIAGALCSATRNTGVFFVFVILFHRIAVWMEERETWTNVVRRPISKSRDEAHKRQHQETSMTKWVNSVTSFFGDNLAEPNLVLGTMLVPAGLFAYMLYLYLHVGDALAFVHIQKAFMRDTKPGIFAVFARAFVLYHGAAWFWIYLILLIGLLGMLFMNRRKGEVAFGVINWLVPLQRGLGCMHRYMHMCVVAEVTFADLCMKLPRRL